MSTTMKLGLVTVNGVTKLVPACADGKVRLSVAEIYRIWAIPTNGCIRIG
jgi:hypothetical protein